jgi:hypothetical protein
MLFRGLGHPSQGKSDWLVVLQQVCSTITLVDAITTAWEH